MERTQYASGLREDEQPNGASTALAHHNVETGFRRVPKIHTRGPFATTKAP